MTAEATVRTHGLRPACPALPGSIRRLVSARMSRQPGCRVRLWRAAATPSPDSARSPGLSADSPAACSGHRTAAEGTSARALSAITTLSERKTRESARGPERPAFSRPRGTFRQARAHATPPGKMAEFARCPGSGPSHLRKPTCAPHKVGFRIFSRKSITEMEN